MNQEAQFMKKINETYLFNTTQQYQTALTKAVVEAPRLDLTGSEFDEVRNAVSRRNINSAIHKLIKNPDVVFIKPSIPLPRSLKVFTVKDIKAAPSYPTKVFIDISELLVENNGTYNINSVDKLIAYLTSAMVQLMYYQIPMKLISNTSLMMSMRKSFAQMVVYIIDYLYKISNIDGTKDMCRHLAALYFDINILKKDYNEQREAINSSALKISGISNRQLDILSIYLQDDSFDNIKTFIETIARVLKLQKLTIDVFVGKWVYIYGTSTLFALEHFTALSDIFTNAYNLSYINNQKTIEKVVGNELTNYSARIIAIGGGMM